MTPAEELAYLRRRFRALLRICDEAIEALPHAPDEADCRACALALRVNRLITGLEAPDGEK